MKLFVIIISVVLLFGLTIVFGSRNEQMVTINYLIAQGEFRLPVVLGVTFIAGFLISWVIAYFYILKLKLRLHSERKKNQKLMKKLPSTEQSKPLEQQQDIPS